jgi:hypothetical protein
VLYRTRIARRRLVAGIAAGLVAFSALLTLSLLTG